MPKITPLNAVPVTRPEGVAAASLARLEPGTVLWIDGRITAGSVTVRPYYFENEPTSSSPLLGAWIPLGTDATAGNGTAFAAAQYGGCANGRYDTRRVDAFWVLVKESPVGLTEDFFHISTEN